MSYSWLSIMGMYEYDPTVLDGLNVPEGMNKDTVVNNILLNCAELELIFSNIDIMKLAISTWSESNQLGWEKMYKTMTVEYNPIWNVDADILDSETISGAKANTRNIGRESESLETQNLTDTKSVQGFNSSSWAAAEKIDHTGTDKIESDETVVETENGTDSTERTYTQRRTGNIGVTTTQQMLEQERKIAEFNMVDYITNSFKKRFCLLIY